MLWEVHRCCANTALRQYTRPRSIDNRAHAAYVAATLKRALTQQDVPPGPVMAARITPVTNSSFITGLGYDDDTQELTVQFSNGREAVYSGVDEGTYQEFASAKSLGSFWHASIKDNYTSRRG